MIEDAFEKIGGGWNRLVMNRRNWWLPLAIVLAVGLGSMIFVGTRTYQDAPPIPDFVAESGETVVAAKSAMVSLDRRLSSAELGDTIERLGKAMAQLVKLFGELDLAVRASREDFVMSLKHVRQATEDLREFSRIIAQDPSVLLRGKEAKE